MTASTPLLVSVLMATPDQIVNPGSTNVKRVLANMVELVWTMGATTLATALMAELVGTVNVW